MLIVAFGRLCIGGGGSVMIWGGISWRHKTSLVVVEGNLTAQRYIDAILNPVAAPFIETQNDVNVLQQDDARPNSSRATQAFLQQNNIETLAWPDFFTYGINLDSCRPVYCPFGQVRVGGVCTLIGRSWFVSNIQVVVRLYPTRSERPSVHKMLQTTDEQLDAQNTVLLHRLGLQDWDVEVYFSVCQNDTVICYFVAALSLQNKQVKPSFILDELDRILRRSWTYQFANVTLNFKPSLNAYSSYQKLGNKTFYTGTWEAFTPRYFSSIDQDGDDIIYSVSSSNTLFFERLSGSVLYITKLFFCEQVDLALEDFVMVDEKVFINNSRISLGTNEYQMTWPRDIVSGVRVCLEDFTGEKNGVRRSATDHVFMVIDVVMMSLFVSL